MKQSLKTLSFIFSVTFLSSSLHAQELVTVIKIIDGDTLRRTKGKSKADTREQN